MLCKCNHIFDRHGFPNLEYSCYGKDELTATEGLSIPEYVNPLFKFSNKIPGVEGNNTDYYISYIRPAKFESATDRDAIFASYFRLISNSA